MRSLAILLASAFSLLVCCFPPLPGQQQGPEGRNAREAERYIPPKSRPYKAPKKPDKKKQAFCSQKTNSRFASCKEERKCADACKALFSKKSHRDACGKLPQELVFDYEDLLDETRRGHFESLDPSILDCFLDIDLKEFLQSLKKLSGREARELLALIAEDEDLADVLEEEDEDFRILKEILNAAFSSKDISSALKSRVDDGRSFFHLIAEAGNEDGYTWVSDYVEDVCNHGSLDECPGRKPLGAHCKHLLGYSALRDFLSAADRFADEFEEEIEDEGHAYTSSGFRDYCAAEHPSSVAAGPGSGNGGGGGGGGGGSPSPPPPTCQASTTARCPAGGSAAPPPPLCKLADVTFASQHNGGTGDESGTDHVYSRSGFTQRGGAIAAAGSIDPSTNKIYRIIDHGDTVDTNPNTLAHFYIDHREITGFDTSWTWYLYIDGTRYALRYDRNGHDPSENHYRVFEWTGNVALGQRAIHWSYEDSSNNCHWIRP